MEAASRNKIFLALTGLAVTLAGCATPAPPPPPPAPPPVAVVIPQKPTPPLGAIKGMSIPPVRYDGLRMTVNRDLQSDESLWHFRAAYNVAALTCTDPKYTGIIADYGAFLNDYKQELNRANKALEAKYRSEHGSTYMRVRDTHMTELYNFFSLPPVKEPFCEVTYARAQQLKFIDKSQLATYAFQALNAIDQVFNDFFDAYERYERELAQWNSLYNPGYNQPGSALTQGGYDQGSAGYSSGYDNASSSPQPTNLPPSSAQDNQDPPVYGPETPG